MSAFEEIECYMSPIQALYERDMSANSDIERDLCAVQTRYERDELDMSADIAQYGCNMSAFYGDGRNMSDMSAIRVRLKKKECDMSAFRAPKVLILRSYPAHSAI